MLTLNDGRSELWQWDTGRKLSVDADCSQVHFSNKVFGRSIDVDVIDGVAEIPDFLLQTDKELCAWAFVGTAENGYTKISKVFKVNKRNKPADYVFTPPEQTTLQELVERLDAIEESQDPDAIKNAVEDYLEQNPVESPVQSVNGYTGKVELTAEDVGARPDNWTPTAQEVGALPDTYTPPNQTAEQVGADPKGTAKIAVDKHNVDTDSHNDIRLELKELSDRLTAFFDSDDTTLDELSEIVAYITSNKALIDSITTSKVSVADIINNLTTNVANKPLSAAQGVVLKKLIDGLSTGKLDANALQSAVNDALAQAKASGEFKGDPGTAGKDGTSVTITKVTESTADGGSNVVTFSDGKTVAIKNGSKGSTGANGSNGTNGVSVSSVKQTTTSSADGGSNVVTVTLSNGTTSTFTVKNGSKGSTGDTGATGPQGPAGKSGVYVGSEEPADEDIVLWIDPQGDLLTMADVVDKVVAVLGTPVFGRVDADNNIILTGELAAGTYTIKYEDEEGNVTEIGTLDHNGEDEPTYTNQIPISTDTDGSVYNTTGYKTASRINSSGGISAVSNTAASNPAFATGFIPCKQGDVIRLANCFIDTVYKTGNDYYGQDSAGLRIAVYDSSKTYITAASWTEYESSGLLSDYIVDSNGHITKFSITNVNCAFVRLCLGGDPANAVVTINEEIE